MNTQTTATALMQERIPDYFEPSYPHRLLAMFRGLRQPRSSREYRAAVIEMQRLSAPLAAVLLPFLAVGLLLLLENNRVLQDRVFPTEVLDVEPIPKLKDLADFLNKADPIEVTASDVSITGPNTPVSTETPDPNRPFSQTPIADHTPVLNIKSVVHLRGILGGNRSADARVGLIKLYKGDQMTEDAVLRALRWLKKNQQADGSWNSQKIAMTGLAILTFLAHDERPGASPEFGDAVQHAIEFLLSNQKTDGRFNGADGNEYAHPIATYALCEAYGMTLNPNVKAAAEKAIIPIINGQHPTGGWNYKLDPNVSAEDGKYRDDTSYMGWCAQAVKAAKLAKLQTAGLDKAVKLAVKGFQRNANPNGGFGYTAPGQGGLTSVGTLCMQLLGAANETEVRRSLDLMDSWQPSFEAKSPIGNSLQYYFYYATQAKFHAGGKRWENWNKEMKHAYVSAQKIEKDGLKDIQGKAVDIGWWANGDTHTDRPVMDTCLAALQLMVYYRNLPTTSTAALEPPDGTFATAIEEGDIPVQMPKNL